ncbi:MAG TPA: zf-HC2 domain-containing protein [Blastocatellia bacterium]
MNCEQCENELEDFLYGELGEARAAEVSAHLRSCAVCGALRDEIDRENKIFGRFYEQTSIEPAAGTWEAIRARIKSEARGRTPTGRELGWLERLRIGALAPVTLRRAAFAALLVLLSAAATTICLKLGAGNDAHDLAVGDENRASSPPPRRAAPPPAPPSPSGDFSGARSRVSRSAPPRKLTDREIASRQIARAEREYQKAISLLDQVIARQRDRLDPALIEQYESSLTLIDDSIDVSRHALRDRPDDPAAGELLLSAYAKKLDLMQEIAMK